MVLNIVLLFILFSIIILIIKVIKSKEIHNKLLLSNLLGTHTIILICLFGSFYDSYLFIDIAIIYALINYISITMILKYYSNKNN